MGYEGGMLVIRDKDARDSGQLLHFGDFFVSLHCHSLRTANGKLTTKNGGRNDRGAHLPNLFLNVEPLKKKGKKKMKKEVWKTILQVIIAVLTAVGTTLGVTSCM